jgi:peptide/nickel transport system ATP-binding protein
VTLLAVDGLAVEADGGRRVVDGVGFTLERGEILGLVGESGSGKTMACRALVRLLPGRNLRVVAGRAVLDGTDILALPERALRAVRGRRVGMIFQNPAAHLDPVMRIGAQIAESVRVHHGLGRRAAWDRAVELLRDVGIPDPAARARSYSHEFSGGMRQRAMIALALAPDPDVLVADEPTTALDVTVQAQILRLLRDLCDRRGLGIVFITHDLGVVAQLTDRVVVLYGGRVCERGATRELLARPRHPYTAGLVACQPASGAGLARLRTIAGQPPTSAAMPPGCRFHPRCPAALPVCRAEQPPLAPFAPGHDAACHNPVPLPARLPEDA